MHGKMKADVGVDRFVAAPPFSAPAERLVGSDLLQPSVFRGRNAGSAAMAIDLDTPGGPPDANRARDETSRSERS
jgi:hypothetical protein